MKSTSTKPGRAPVRAKGASGQRVYEAIQRQLLSLDVLPGTNLDEVALAELHGVSRTPVREALVRLAADGLVVLLPNRGSQVATLDTSDIRDYLEAIDLFQRAAMRWATLRRTTRQVTDIEARCEAFERASQSDDPAAMVMANREFHAGFADACGNAHLAHAYRRILAEGLRVASYTINRLPVDDAGNAAFIANIIAEHRDMVICLRNRDAERIERIAAHHTDIARERLVDFLRATLSPEIRVDTSLDATKRYAT